MANRWGNKKTVTDFIFLGSKITADGDFSREIKRRLLLWRIAMTNLGSILKSRDITLLTKVHIVKDMVFPVVMYGYESWTIKKAECWRTELWCWRKLLRVCWTARRSNQSNLMEISPEYLLEGLMLKLKLHFFGHLMWRTDSLKKTLMLGKIEGGRRRGRQDEMVEWHHRLDGPKFEQALGVGNGQGSLACCSPWGCKQSDTTERLTDLLIVFGKYNYFIVCPVLDFPWSESCPHLGETHIYTELSCSTDIYWATSICHGLL